MCGIKKIPVSAALILTLCNTIYNYSTLKVRAESFKSNVLCLSVSVQAAEVEKQLSTQVHSLRDDFREKSISTSQHMTRLETLQAEVSHYH